MKFQKKPIEVEAIQWTGDNLEDVYQFMGEDRKVKEWKGRGRFDGLQQYVRGEGVFLQTHSGIVKAHVGNWIIKGVDGEYYPCPDAVFKETYEPAEKLLKRRDDEEEEEE